MGGARLSAHGEDNYIKADADVPTDVAATARELLDKLTTAAGLKLTHDWKF